MTMHQYRSQQYARQAGFEQTAALTCGSPAYLLPCYWTREIIALPEKTQASPESI